MNKFLGISLAVLGIALAVGPLATDCTAHGKLMANGMTMHCYANRIPELAIGIPLAFGGVLSTFKGFQKRPALFSIFAAVILLGVSGVLVPTTFVGTCGNPVMFCNTMMKPTVTAAGSLAAVGGLAGMVISLRKKS